MPHAERIKQARIDAGLTQTELAERSGISQPAISAVESGADVRLSTLERIAEALGVPAAKLVD